MFSTPASHTCCEALSAISGNTVNPRGKYSLKNCSKVHRWNLRVFTLQMSCRYMITWQGTTWWRHQMETFSVSLALCVGNSPVTGEFPSQRPVTWSFDVFFDLHLNKRFSKQSWGCWFETPWHSLWRHCSEDKTYHYGCQVPHPTPIVNRTESKCWLEKIWSINLFHTICVVLDPIYLQMWSSHCC